MRARERSALEDELGLDHGSGGGILLVQNRRRRPIPRRGQCAVRRPDRRKEDQRDEEVSPDHRVDSRIAPPDNEWRFAATDGYFSFASLIRSAILSAIGC